LLRAASQTSRYLGKIPEKRTGKECALSGPLFELAPYPHLSEARRNAVPAPRRNDPLGISDTPRNLVSQARVSERLDEFKRRLAHIRGSYQLALEARLGDREFNGSLAKLKRSLARKRPSKRRGDRAHPEIEMVISQFAKANARNRTGLSDAAVTQEDANRAASKAAQILRSRKGRASNAILRFHVEGLMALLQEMSGRPVQFTHYKDNAYEPQPTGKLGKIMLEFCKEIDPSVTETMLASMVKAARRNYAGKPMRFADFFPLYGATSFAPDGTPELETGYRVEHFEPNIPIYFP
jgi:hypothetical protein